MSKKSRGHLKRVIAAALILVTVSGYVPMQPIAEVFSPAITASAADTNYNVGVDFAFDSSSGKLTLKSANLISETSLSSTLAQAGVS